MMKYCWILIFLCATFFISEAASPDSLFKNADSLYRAGNYTGASVGYAEIAFSEEDPGIKAEAVLKRSYCLKKRGDYRKAVQVLQQVPFFQINDSLNYQIRYETALNSYLNKNYTEADAQFRQMDFFIKDSNLTDKSLYLRILVKNELYDWKEARNLFLKYSTIHQVTENDSFRMFILDQYDHHIPKLKDAEKAGLMSTFIPGSGQFYAGYPGEAMLSFGLNAASLITAVYLIYKKYYLTGWLGGLGLLGRFYQGGTRRASELVDEHNSRVSNKFNELIKINLLLLEKTKTRQ